MDENIKPLDSINMIQINLLEEKLTYNDNKFFSDFNKRNFIRVVCISDTHTHTEGMHKNIPDGDILIHAGDFSYSGQPKEIDKFKKFLNLLPHTKKIVIAGNHDITFDEERYESLKMKYKLKIPKDELMRIKKFPDDVIYLENSMVNLHGFNFYGTPYSKKYFEWAFMKNDHNLNDIWKNIPEDTDLLISHGPPMYIGDKTFDTINAGSFSLYNHVKDRIKPMYHIFGHIHEGYGCYIDSNIPGTIFINCSILDHEYDPVNSPIVFDLIKKEYIT